MSLVRQGIPVVLIDRATHPRFAIGESTTPLGDSTLQRIARRYGLDFLLPLTQYGAWKNTYPHLMCGRKRGFTYFDQTTGFDLTESDFRSRRMLSSASESNAVSDTQWLRSDVDQFFFEHADRLGVQCLQGCDYQFFQTDSGWKVKGTSEGTDFQFEASFLIDATGAGGGVLRELKIPYQTEILRTNSRSIFGHFSGAKSCETLLTDSGIQCDGFPFACDDAAVHQVLRDGWMWQIRFDDDSLSAGFVLDARSGATNDLLLSPQREWDMRIAASPFLKRQFWNAELIRMPRLCATSRIQRLTTQAAGSNWATLANTAGFIDALHSTGIAHTLFTVERLADILGRDDGEQLRTQRLNGYSEQLIQEIRHVDLLVEGCYAALPCFDLWCDWAMLYLSAATSMEQKVGNVVSSDDSPVSNPGLLRAADSAFVAMLNRARVRLGEVVAAGSVHQDCIAFRIWLREEVEPWNLVGLFDSLCDGLYSSTAAPKRLLDLTLHS
ncbi:MAG: tryptophan 7-halogenase [Planctomyces sp.]|nr:tryptophan 7-halogenase [Planctomyces sp.]